MFAAEGLQRGGTDLTAWFRAALVAGVAVLTLLACGSSGGGTAPQQTQCVPGRQSSCPCAGTSLQGTQICKADGSGLDPCTGCPGDMANDGGNNSSVTDAQGDAPVESSAEGGACAADSVACSHDSDCCNHKCRVSPTGTSSVCCYLPASVSLCSQVCGNYLDTCTYDFDCCSGHCRGVFGCSN
jgi:hypothetical protein